MSRDVAKGRVGLSNLGNTCFMNAAIQCLLHAPELVLPFLDCVDNPIEGQSNDKYKLVREFAKLARTHYSATVKSQNPQQFRKSIKNIASFLCDGDQHDSHELMNFILQGLEEELNKHRDGETKIENNFIPDYSADRKAVEAIINEELSLKAKEWWNSYKCFNDCFITDMLYGEICNRIECTKCGKCVYNYSSFNTLYVPVRSNTIVVTVNLVLQGFSAEDDAINIQILAIPISLKASDSLKMLDHRLHERLEFSSGDTLFSTKSTLDPNQFKETRTLFVSGSISKFENQTKFSKLDPNTRVSLFASSKSLMLLAYLTPPVPVGCVPILLSFNTLRASGQSGVVATSPMDSIKWSVLSLCMPLVFILPKATSVQDMHSRMLHVLQIVVNGRLTSNASNVKERHLYYAPYSRVHVNTDYFFDSVFFTAPSTTDEQTAEIHDETVDETACETVDETPAEMSTNIISEESVDMNAETPSGIALPITMFPRFYLTTLDRLKTSILSLAAFHDITDEEGSPLLLSEAWPEGIPIEDVRCVMCVLNVNGINDQITVQFNCNTETRALDVVKRFFDLLMCCFDTVDLKEECVSSMSTPSLWGKKKGTEENHGSGQLRLQDCMELKKTTVVMLDGKSSCQHCHDSNSLATTPYLCRLPPLLVIQLKRFEYSTDVGTPIFGSGCRSSRKQAFGRKKIDVYVDYPVKEFDVSEYVMDSIRDEIVDPSQMRYELIGVINHSGTADFGHYFAYCKDGYNGADNWFEYNDSSVSAIREENVVTKNAYVLLYRRSDLGNAVYSRISDMEIIANAKKGSSAEEVKDVISRQESNLKLSRERKEGVDNERKEGKEEDEKKVSLDMKKVYSDEEKGKHKKRISKKERKLQKKDNGK